MERDLIDTEANQQELDFSIVSAKLTIEAMRDSGYKDTDHALAELIDNSIEARADSVDIIAVEVPPDPDLHYAQARIGEIAVVDNGEGMDSIVLRRALKFGDGTRMDRQSRGIGRFGVGLPQSLNITVPTRGYMDMAERSRQRPALLSRSGGDQGHRQTGSSAPNTMPDPGSVATHVFQFVRAHRDDGRLEQA